MISLGITDSFRPVSLEQLEELSLMNRTDTKYVFPERKLEEFLNKLLPYYQILEIRNTRVMPYHSVYFDTEDFYLYHCHHNGRKNRFKIRLRDYMVSDISFFEIKKKTNKDRTKKKRMQVPFCTECITPESMSFLTKHSDLEGKQLIRTLDNRFSRITLAGFSSMERVTIDLGVSYERDGRILEMPGLVIAEVKRGTGSNGSPVISALKEMKIYACGFSKYCIGIVSMVDTVKYNNFKPKLLNLKKIIQ